MSGVVHNLDVSITAALALKPSTMYNIKVENRESKQSWHIRRCYSDFMELREKILLLVEGMNEIKNEFPFLFKNFPRRQLFGSRSKRVIQHRAIALDQFLYEALRFIDEIKKQQRIAVYFSMMSFMEKFFDCARYDKKKTFTSQQAPASLMLPKTRSFLFSGMNTTTVAVPFPTIPGPTSLTRTVSDGCVNFAASSAYLSSVSKCSTDPSLHCYVSASEVHEDDDDEEEDDEEVDELDAEMEKHLRLDQDEEEPHHTSPRHEIDDLDHHLFSTEQEESMYLMIPPKGTLFKMESCMFHRELKEMPTYYSGSHYGALESNGRGEKKGGGAEAWAARIEIAGLKAAAALEAANTLVNHIPFPSEQELKRKKLGRITTPSQPLAPFY